MLMFHGGGGHQRGFHLLALESRIPEYTDQGYTVYLPFYRLIGQGDTNIECSDAGWHEVKTDAEKALEWVKTNQAEFGDRSNKVTLFAQGSGALLAGWLHTQQPESVEKSVMFYPVLDTGEMRDDVLAGNNPKARDLLERIFREKLETVSNDNPVLLETSYWKQMSKTPESFPPLFMLHGLRDDRVSPNQTVGSCNALGGNANTVPVETRKLECGGSKAYLLAGAEYHLDYCFTVVECPAGDEQSRDEVEQAIMESHQWLKGGEG